MEALIQTPANESPIPKPVSRAFLWAVAILFLSAGPITAQADDRAPWILKPDSVKAGTAFDLGLLSHRFNCATTYSHQSVKIEGKRVTLSFLPTNRPDAICPAVYMPYGPTFAMSPLAAGYYDVYARVLAPCMVPSTPSGPVCMMEAVPEFAGVLSVGVTDRRGWFLRPAEVEADKGFTMHILSHAYGNCNTSFTREVLEKRGGAFYASFVIEQHPDHVCITDIRPHGPSFEVKGQPVGRYPVYANPQQPCRYASPPCLAASSPDQWILVDTLAVTKGGPTGVIPGSQRFQPGQAVFPRGTLDGGYKADGRKAMPLKER
jgi:hypothetical protein